MKTMVDITCPICGFKRSIVKAYLKHRKSNTCRKCFDKHKGELVNTKRENNPFWKGGIYKAGQYTAISLPKDHSRIAMADNTGRIYEHRLVMANFLNRDLESWEVVHHKNGDKLDNRLENLELMNQTNHTVTILYTKEINSLKQRIEQLEIEVEQLKDKLDYPYDSLYYDNMAIMNGELESLTEIKPKLQLIGK